MTRRHHSRGYPLTRRRAAVAFATVALSGCAINVAAPERPQRVPTAFETAPTLPEAVGGDALNDVIAVAEPNSDRTQVLALLPRPGTRAGQVSLSASGRRADLVVRLRASLSEFPEWYLDYTTATPGGPGPPFRSSPEFSKTDYEQYRAAVHADKVYAISNVAVGTTAAPDGRLEVAWTVGGRTDHFLLDASTLELETPFGTSPQPLLSVWRDPGAPNGLSSSWKWDWTDPSLESDLAQGTGSSLRVVLSEPDREGRVNLDVRNIRVAAGAVVESSSVSMLYSILDD